MSNEDKKGQFQASNGISDTSNYENISDGSLSSDSDKENEVKDVVKKEPSETFQSHKRRKTGDNMEEGKKRYEEKDKHVLIEKERTYFEVLPEGWIEIGHSSGMPLYFHKKTRVCTLAKPYFLGPGSTRYHDIPVSAIPCLSYRKTQEKEALRKQGPIATKPDVTNIGGSSFPRARIETAQQHYKTHNLTPNQVKEYCDKLFKFKTIKIKKFTDWNDRREHMQKYKELERPVLPSGTKLITVPIQNAEQDSSGNKKDCTLNPSGKNYVTILHEYVQHTLKKQPVFKFVPLQNDTNPHMATVAINDVHYGIGLGPNKKIAKNEAAKATLEILFPEMSEITADDRPLGSAATKQDKDLSFFDEIKIEDPRVAELCEKVGEPCPYAILETCLKVKYFEGNMYIKCQWNTLSHQKNELTMTAGKYTATVICKNERDGKNRGAQAIIKAMHPKFTSWGQILKVYGSKFVNKFSEKKKEERDLKYLQFKHRENISNIAIINRLKSEMTKLKDSKAEVKPTATCTAPPDSPPSNQ